MVNFGGMKISALVLSALCAATVSANAQGGSPEPSPSPGVVTPMPPEGLSVGPGTKAPALPAGEEPGLEAAAMELFKAFQGGSTTNPLAKLGGQPVVDFRELKALLPEEMSGLRRGGARGEKTGFMGAQISVAQGEYGKPDGPRLEAKITDLGGMGLLGSLAGFGWLATEVDREGDQGYERTIASQGHKGYEKYDKTTRTGSVSLVVQNRFLIEIEGRNVDAEQIKAATTAIDIGSVEQLAKPKTPQ